MIALASVIERFESDYFAQYGASCLPSHAHALAAMKRCRTQLAPRMLAHCGACGQERVVPHSCGHRSCPHCQHHESQAWIEAQLTRLVPASYFMLTFTLPAELRELAWRHQRWFYAALFECAWATVNTFSHNDKKLQGNPGAVAVLHTHTRRLDYHPHVHLVMPAAALDAQNHVWRTKCAQAGKGTKGSKGQRQDKPYLFNHKALAQVFRAKLLAAIQLQGWALPPRLPHKWVVDCKCVGSGEKALVYLGRYLYRGVIQEKDIVRCSDGQVSFRYRDAKTGKMALRTLSGAAFLRLLLQHVLPKGLRRARNFGFLHPNSKRLIALLHLVLRVVPPSAPIPLKPRPTMQCPCCGQPMQIVRRRMCPATSEREPVREPEERWVGVAML